MHRMLILRASISKLFAVEVARDGDQCWLLKIGSFGWCGGWFLPAGLVLRNFPLNKAFPLVLLAKNSILLSLSPLELRD